MPGGQQKTSRLHLVHSLHRRRSTGAAHLFHGFDTMGQLRSSGCSDRCDSRPPAVDISRRLPLLSRTQDRALSRPSARRASVPPRSSGFGPEVTGRVPAIQLGFSQVRSGRTPGPLMHRMNMSTSLWSTSASGSSLARRQKGSFCATPSAVRQDCRKPKSV